MREITWTDIYRLTAPIAAEYVLPGVRIRYRSTGAITLGFPDGRMAALRGFCRGPTEPVSISVALMDREEVLEIFRKIVMRWGTISVELALAGVKPAKIRRP